MKSPQGYTTKIEPWVAYGGTLHLQLDDIWKRLKHRSDDVDATDYSYASSDSLVVESYLCCFLWYLSLRCPSLSLL